MTRPANLFKEIEVLRTLDTLSKEDFRKFGSKFFESMGDIFESLLSLEMNQQTDDWTGDDWELFDKLENLHFKSYHIFRRWNYEDKIKEWNDELFDIDVEDWCYRAENLLMKHYGDRSAYREATASRTAMTLEEFAAYTDEELEQMDNDPKYKHSPAMKEYWTLQGQFDRIPKDFKEDSKWNKYWKVAIGLLTALDAHADPYNEEWNKEIEYKAEEYNNPKLLNRIRSGENEIEPIEEFKARLLLDKFHAEFGICARLIRSTVKDPENPEEKDFLTSIEEIDFLKRCYWSADKELVDKVEYQRYIEKLYKAIADNDINREMELKRECFMKFGAKSDLQEKHCYDLLQSKCLGRNTITAKPRKRRNVRLTGTGIDWALCGFAIANDVNVHWGERGSGKTRLALEIAYSLMTGDSFLDRNIKPEPTKVLYIASDSGRAPIEEELEAAGLHTEFSEHENWELWCHDPESQQEAWGVDLRSRIELYEWAKENKGACIIQDSAKAIFGREDNLDYTNNKDVTQYLLFLKEVIAPYCTIIVCAHDGSASGRSGGAKAWEEIPSFILGIVKPKDEEGNQVSDRRIITIHKSRKGDERRLNYEIGEDGRLKCCDGTEIINDVSGLIYKFMQECKSNNKDNVSVEEIFLAVKQTKKWTAKGTVSNNLSRMSTGKMPKLQKVPNKKGMYRINPYYTRSINSK